MFEFCANEVAANGSAPVDGVECEYANVIIISFKIASEDFKCSVSVSEEHLVISTNSRPLTY